jgi:parallel beta-helix repeat protein
MALLEETQTYSVWQRRTVPTIRINSTTSETGARLTLQEVINEAPHYAKIVLTSGLQFVEQIIISRPLELCGDDGEEPCITSRGPTITISADIPCFFSGIKVRVRTMNATASVSRMEPPAVLVTSGRPVFFRCDLSSFCAAGVSQPVVERCSIQGNLGGSGLVVRDAAAGTYLANEITNHTGFCVECTSRGSPKFTNNEVYAENDPKSGANAGTGVLRISGMSGAHAGGGGSESNEILFSGNRFLDIFSDIQKQTAAEIFGTERNRWIFTQDITSQRRSVVIENCSPVLVDNIIEGGVVGVSMVNAGGTYLNNIISQSILCAIVFMKGTQAVLESHKISNHMGGGVYIDGCSPTLRSCVIQQCKGVGVSINSSMNFTVSKCFVEKNRCGVSIIGHSGGVVSDCEICRNDYIGIRVSDPGCRTRISQNLLFNNGGAGVYVINHATPRISQNGIHGQRVGLLVVGGSIPIVTENEIQGNDEFAVSVAGGAKGTFKQNKLMGGSTAVVRVQERCSPTFDGNEIADGTVGLLLTNKAIGTYSNNTICRLSDGISISQFADPVVSANTVSECSRYGIFVVQDGMGTITGNVVRRNVHGLSAFKGAKATFRGNTVERCVKIGALLGDGCRVLVEKNTFSDHEEHGMVLTGRDCQPVCRSNTFTSCKGFGCLSESGAEGVVSGSFFAENGVAGFGTEDGGSTEFRDNKSIGDRGPAILCRNKGFGSFYDCICEDGKNSGCILSDGARPILINCTFQNFNGDGIEVCESAHGEVVSCAVRQNRKCGISFTGLCSTVVDQLKSEGNQEDGVLFCKQAASKLTRATVSGHAIGIRIQAAGESLVSQCVVQRNQRGMVIMEGGSATVLDCSFSFAMDAHIELTEKGSGTIRNCTLTDSSKNGVLARNMCKGIMEGCKIHRCSGIGLVIEGGGDPKVDKCEIAECNVGLSCTEKALGTLTDTAIVSNRESNVTIAGHSKSVFVRCIIARCKDGPGVTTKLDESRFTDCQIQGNATYGFLAGDRCRAIVKTTVIQGNSRTGIYCTKGAEPIFNHNKVCENHQSGVILATNASPTFTENDISDNMDSGILCCHNCQGIFSKNSIMRNNVANIRVFTESTTVFTGNTIQQGRNIGIVTQGGSARFEENHITQHTNTAILVIGPSNVVFVKNAIQSNNIGVVLEAEGKIPLPDPVGVDPTTIIATQTAQQPVKRRQRGIAGPTAAQQPKAPELLCSSVTLDSNVFSANLVAGVQLREKSIPNVVKNQFCDGDTGVQIFATAGGIVESNIFMMHRLCAVEVAGAAITTKIRLNLFDQNEIGILIKGNTSSTNKKSRPSSARSDRGAAGPPRVNILGALERDDDLNSLYEGSDDSDSSEPTESKPLHIDSNGAATAAAATVAVVTITKNTFLRNRRHGCYLTEMSESKIIGNVFQAELCGIGGTSSSAPSIEENMFCRCTVGVHSGATTNFLVEKNTFTDETEIGVYCNGGTGLVTCNIFTNCVVAGVCTEGAGCPTVTRNLFAHNNYSPWSAGIYMRKGGSGYFSDNDLHENSIGARCDNGGIGSITNDFFHDNGYGLFVASNGMCTVSTCFFCCNSVADVCSAYGGRPNVSRCVMHDTAKPILITMYGGGSFTYNIMKNVDGAAIALSLPLPNDEKPVRTKPKGIHERLIEPAGDVIDRDAVMYLLTLEEIVGRIAVRSIPTISSNLIAQCTIGIDIDCGAPTKHRVKAKDEHAAKDKSAAPAEPTAPVKKFLRSVAKSADYESPLPNLSTLQRAEYWAIISRNLITQCVFAVAVSKGPTDRPPRFVPATDVVLDESTVDPSVEQNESATVKHVVMQAEDDIRMTYFEDNTFILNETGIQLRQGGNARFDRNYITRCTKFGVIVLDEGRGELFENVITDCAGFGVYLQGDPRGKGSSEPSWVNIQDCVITHVRVGISVAGGEPRVAYNRISNCDTGVNIGPAVLGVMISNLIHECKKVGGQCYSEVFCFQLNTFFSSLELGAFEMKVEGIKLPSGNIVRNQFTPRITKSDPAQKVNLLGEQVNEATSAKEQKDLFSNLRDMHAKQLPGSELGGCVRLGAPPRPAAVSGAVGSASSEIAAAARRKSLQSVSTGSNIATSIADALSKSQTSSHGGKDEEPAASVPLASRNRSVVGRGQLLSDDTSDYSTSYNVAGGAGAVFGETKWGAGPMATFQPSVVSMNAKSWGAMASVKMGRQDGTAEVRKPPVVIARKKGVAAPNTAPLPKPAARRKKPKKVQEDSDDSGSAFGVPVKQKPSAPAAKPSSPTGKLSSPYRSASPQRKATDPSPTRATSFKKQRTDSESPKRNPINQPLQRSPIMDNDGELGGTGKRPPSEPTLTAVDEDLLPVSELHIQDLTFPGGASSSSSRSRPPSEHSQRSGRQSSSARSNREDFRPVDGFNGHDASPLEGDDAELFALPSSAARSREGSVRAASAASSSDPLGSSRGRQGSRLSRLSADGDVGGEEGGDVGPPTPPSPAVAPPPRKPSPVLIKKKLTGVPRRIMSKRRVMAPTSGEEDQPPQPRRRGDRPSAISILEGDQQEERTEDSRKDAILDDKGVIDVPYVSAWNEQGADDSDDEKGTAESKAGETDALPASEIEDTQSGVPRSEGDKGSGEGAFEHSLVLAPAAARVDDDGNDDSDTSVWLPPSTAILPPGSRQWMLDRKSHRLASRRGAVDGPEDVDEDESTHAVVNQPVSARAGRVGSPLTSSGQAPATCALPIHKGSLSDDEYVSMIVSFTKRITVAHCSHAHVGSGAPALPNSFTFFRGESPNFHLSRLYGNSVTPTRSKAGHGSSNTKPTSSDEDEVCADNDDDDAMSSMSRTFSPQRRPHKAVVQLGFGEPPGEHAKLLGKMQAVDKQPSAVVSRLHTQHNTQRPVSCSKSLFDPLVSPSHPPSNHLLVPAYKNFMQSLLSKREGLQEAWCAGPRAGPYIPVVPEPAALPLIPTSPATLTTGAPRMSPPPSMGLLPPAEIRTAVSPLVASVDTAGLVSYRDHARVAAAERELFIVGRSRPETADPRFDTNLVPQALDKGRANVVFHTKLALPARDLVAAVPQAQALEEIHKRITTPSAHLAAGERLTLTVQSSQLIKSDSQRDRTPQQMPLQGKERDPMRTPEPPQSARTIAASPVTYSLPVQVASRPPSVQVAARRQQPPTSAGTERAALPFVRRASDARLQTGSNHIIFGDIHALTRRRYRSHTVDGSGPASLSAGQLCRSVTPSVSTALPLLGQIVKRGAGEALIPYSSMM